MGEKMRRSLVLFAAASATLMANQSFGQVDTLQLVIEKVNTIPSTGGAFQTFGYDTDNDRAFTVNANGAQQVIRMISNVGGTQTVQDQINQTAWLMFAKSGHTEYSGGGAFPGGFMLNPKPVPALGAAANSFMVIIDQSSLIKTPADAPELTHRIYRYNLAQDTNGDAREEMTPLVTLGQLQTAAGVAATVTGNTILRQGAWSGDGQSIYWNDSITTAGGLGGIWTVPVAGGAPVRVLAATDINTEPAVTTAGTVDSIYFRGGGSTANDGGIDKITYDGSTAGTRQVALSAAGLADFLEVTSGTPNVATMTSDDAGNIYFCDSVSAVTGHTDHRGIYRVDPLGRLSKVVGYGERQAFFGGTPQGLSYRMQPRTVSYGSGSTAFNVTQILYAELSTLGLVAGAYAFEPGDFNRDNVVNQADVDLFKTKITTHATIVAAAAADLRFDMNGSNTIDWKDIKVFQQFDSNLYDGDANMDGAVDITDLGTLATNWQTGGQSWLGADFTGDDFVDISDLGILATNWQLGVPAGASIGSFDAALASVGLSGVAVPEPASMSMLVLLAGAAARRRRV